MTRLRSLFGGARSARGAVVVLFAVCMPVFILFAGVVIDVGNWLEHNRHLQVQADAGALAGAQEFRYPCNDEAITDEVSEYSSVDVPDGGAGRNPQVGDTPSSELHQEINSPTFHDQDEPVDETVREGPPCDAKMIDVKLTETDLPWWLKSTGLVPYINAQARVEFRQQDIATGALPVGVPEVDPKKVRAYFVDESLPDTDANYILASTELVQGGSENGMTIWSNTDAPLPVDIDVRDVGVRVAVSSSDSTSCGSPLVTCYDSGSDNGLAYIRGWSGETPGGATAATPPQARDVQLVGGSCEDGYFTATAPSYPCTMNISAVVDFGGASLATSRVRVRKTGANAGAWVTLTAPATAGDPWIGGLQTIASASGPTTFELQWQTGCTNASCSGGTSGIIPLVQRTFGASADRSGPIKLLRVSEAGTTGANSFRRCTTNYTTCSHDLVVTVGLKENLENAQSVNDPIVSLKVAGGGSQNQALDCGRTLANLRDELHQGCPETYKVNEGTACPPNATTLWDTAEPWDCVTIATGAAVGQVIQGLNLRVFGDENPPASACADAPNNWANFPNFSPGDPRIVQVFLTPFNAFAGSGGAVVPVLGFASFYITGWDNGPCQPPGGTDDPAGQGSIVGHFIKYINTINNGGGGEEFCDFNSFGSCVAVFTR